MHSRGISLAVLVALSAAAGALLSVAVVLAVAAWLL